MRERFNLSKLPRKTAPRVSAAVKGKPRINGYICTSDDCKRVTITVDVDDGVTPFMIRCPGCKSTAVSCMYPTSGPVPPVESATLEWYKPDEKEMRRMHPANLDHVRRGGLLLRKRTDRAPVCHKEVSP